MKAGAMTSQARTAHKLNRPRQASLPGPARQAGPDQSRTQGSPDAGTPPTDRLSQLVRLFDVTRMLAPELDLAEISHQILVSAIGMVPVADAGTLYLSDAGTGRLIVQDSVGLGPSIHKLSLEPGEGAAGKAFFSRQGAIYNDPEAVSSALSGASNDNFEAFQQATQGLRSPKAAMTVPLLFKGDVLGALVIDKLRDGDGQFTDHDLLLLEDFGQIAAIGIINARLFNLERSTRLRLQVMNDELNRQRDLLDRRLRALDAMAQVAREGFNLDAIASRLAALVCGRTTILDGLGRVRAAAPPDQEPAAPARRMQQQDAAEVLELVSRDRQRHTGDYGGHRLIVSPVAAEMEVLGFVVLELSEAEHDGLAEALVDSAALIVSTVFVREQAREEGDLRRRADLLERLLNGEVPRTAAQFHELRPPFRLAVGAMHRVRDAGRSAGTQHAGVLRELRSITAETMRQQSSASAVALRDDHIVAMWSAEGTGAAVDWAAMFRSVTQAMTRHDGWSARFAMTPVIDDPQSVPQMYREARLALEIQLSAGDPIIDVGTLGAYRLIIGATSSPEVVEFSRRALSAILEHDRKRGGNLLPTLRTYLAAGMSITATAKVLHIHVHTVQYRLAKLEELSRLSLRKSEERLTLELSLRIHDLASAGKPRESQEGAPDACDR